MLVLKHILRDRWHRDLARANGEADVSEDRVTKGTEIHDALAITGAVGIIAFASLAIEHEFHLNSDVIYDCFAMCAAHPLSRTLKTVLLAIF